MIPVLPPSYTSNWTGPDKPGFHFFILVSVNGGLSLYQYVQDKHHHHPPTTTLNETPEVWILVQQGDYCKFMETTMMMMCDHDLHYHPPGFP